MHAVCIAIVPLGLAGLVCIGCASDTASGPASDAPRPFEVDAGDGAAVDTLGDATSSGAAETNDSPDGDGEGVDGDVPPLRNCPSTDVSAVSVSGSGRYRTLTGVDAAGLAPREITVFLPQSYDAAPQRFYPVLYAQDGQNLFFPELAPFGEWRVDEVITTLGDAIEPLIVVGVHNTADRLSEYTAHPDPEYGGGGGDHYADYVATVVKPTIDTLFRTRCGPADTATMGSSLGGLAALHQALRYPEVFGRIGVLSPSLWWADNAHTQAFEAWDRPLPERLWIDMGTAEGQTFTEMHPGVASTRRLRDRAVARGALLGRDLGYLEDVGARHNEAAWADRLPAVLRYLFGELPMPGASGLELSAFSTALSVGAQDRTHLIVTSAHGPWGRLTWRNADVEFSVAPVGVVEVDQDGRVRAVSEGRATVSARAADLSAQLSFTVSAQAALQITFVVDVPADTESVFITGDRAELGGWDPGAVKMTRLSPQRWSIDRVLTPGPVEYKFTRGSWATVEATAAGMDVPNRQVVLSTSETLQDTVSGWIDQ